jgi:hypothetical protein
VNIRLNHDCREGRHHDQLHYKTTCSISILHRASDVRQIEIHTAEPLVPDPGPFDVEIAIANLKRYKSPGSDHIAAELIQAGGEILHSKIHERRSRKSKLRSEGLVALTT